MYERDALEMGESKGGRGEEAAEPMRDARQKACDVVRRLEKQVGKNPG
jgi:hypothetical protein